MLILERQNDPEPTEPSEPAEPAEPSSAPLTPPEAEPDIIRHGARPDKIEIFTPDRPIKDLK